MPPDSVGLAGVDFITHAKDYAARLPESETARNFDNHTLEYTHDLNCL